MVCVYVVSFPQTSVAVQTLVNVYLLSHVLFVIFSTISTVAVPQLSFAVKVAAAGTSDAQETVTLAAGKAPINVGLISSFTVITCVCVVMFPQSSVAVQTLVNVKSFTQDPSTLV